MDSCNEGQPQSTLTLLERGQLHYSEEKYVTRTKKCLPDKFIELCHMHLAFLLDLSGDKLELLLSTQVEHKKKKSGLVSAGMFKKKDKPQVGLFGLPLTDEGVCLVIPLIKFLKMEKNVSKEGLFRKPGNKSRMTTLRESLVAHGPAVNIDPEIYSPYDVACVLKEFLRELPEPLLTERHMEAHRQVSALGQYASSAEEAARYACRKLSALQLLMLLLPPPAQKLTMGLTRLLHKIADCPDTKMTSVTLGTIFAPIFFIDRKVEASELCNKISQTAPAVSFMIEKAQDLFQAPKELVCDLAKYWCDLGQAPLDSQNNSEPTQMKKSLSGRTLNTNVCYIDRELSRCDDIASNTQAELENLIAHVQALPSTPGNVRLKKQIMKSAGTPVLSGKRHRRSRSIGASIKKRLPSLGRFRNKHGESSRTSTSSVSSTDSRVVTSARGQHLEYPAYSTETNNLQRPSQPRHKRSFTSENNSIPSSLVCTPPKQICKEVEHCTTLTSNIDTHIQSHKVNSEEHPTENRDPNILSTFSKLLNHAQTVSPIKLTKGQIIFYLSEKSSDNLPHHAEQISAAVTPRRDNLPHEADQISVAVTPKRDNLPHQAEQISVAVTPRRDNLPHQAEQISVAVTLRRDKELVTEIHHRQCRKPGTPIMPRAVLQLVQHNTPESSF